MMSNDLDDDQHETFLDQDADLPSHEALRLVPRVRTHKEPFRQGAVVIQRPGKGHCDERRSVVVEGGAVWAT